MTQVPNQFQSKLSSFDRSYIAEFFFLKVETMLYHIITKIKSSLLQLCGATNTMYINVSQWF